MEPEILAFLETKPHLEEVIFNVRDIIVCGHYRTSTVVGNRLKLGQQLYQGTKRTPLKIAGWSISLYHKQAQLAKYIARRQT